jgi:hypothetical protein
MSLIQIRFVLVALGWLMAAVALPLRCCDLNGFLAWRGTVTTGFFVRWVFALPRMLLLDYLEPTTAHGAMGARLTAKFDVAGLDVAWLAAVLTGLILVALAPILVYRVRSLRAAVTLRCLAPVLFLLPLTTVAPASWRYPLPAAGMYVLAAAQVVIAVALMLAPLPAAGPAFPIEVKR